MTAVRSFSTAGSSAACEVRPVRAMADRIAAQQTCARLFIASPPVESEGLELGWIRQKTPERFARRGDISSERRIFVLQDRHHLENQKIVVFPKPCECCPAMPRVERAKSLQQIVDLVLERQLGEHTDRIGVAKALLERLQIEDRGSLLRRGRRGGPLSRSRRLWGLGWGRGGRRRLLRRLGRKLRRLPLRRFPRRGNCWGLL